MARESAACAASWNVSPWSGCNDGGVATQGDAQRYDVVAEKLQVVEAVGDLVPGDDWLWRGHRGAGRGRPRFAPCPIIEPRPR